MAEKDVTPKGWKASARRTRYGEKVELKTIPGYWVRPQKMEIERASEYRQMMMESGKHASPETRRMLKAKAEQWKAENPGEDREPTVVETQDLMSDEEWLRMTDVFTLVSADVQMIRFLMLYGIAETNLDDERGNTIVWGEEIVAELGQYEEIAREIAGVAQGWNAPLLHGSDDNS